MSRRFMAWVSVLPLMLAGVESGHWLAYRLVYPDPAERAQVLASSGHGYLSQLPTFFAALGAIALCLLGARILGDPAGASAAAQVSLIPFLVVSPLAFASQECIERLVVGSWPFGAVLTPTFMPGLVFQLPFAFVAFLLARRLLRAADRLRVLLLPKGSVAVPLPSASVYARWPLADLPRIVALATGSSERGPPLSFSPASALYR